MLSAVGISCLAVTVGNWYVLRLFVNVKILSVVCMAHKLHVSVLLMSVCHLPLKTDVFLISGSY